MMRVVSGIQPTGIVHLGNYFGALINWMQKQHEGHTCFFFIADQHAITIPQEPKKLREHILSLAAILLAVGLDPEKSTIFVQSDVPAHLQLAWILGCLTPLGQMERMIQFKEKIQKKPSAANIGLLTYPIIMAADILIYKADLVPVGIDQAQHLELTRILAEKFNRQYQTIFPLPKTLHTKTTKVVGLDGSSKMSKSLNNFIGLTENNETLWNKLAKAATDPSRVTKKDTGNPFICNIHALHTLFSSKEDVSWVQKGCQTAGIGCMDCKKRLYENLSEFLKPIRSRYLELMQKPKQLQSILKMGAEKANKESQKTLNEVNDAIGFSY